MILHIQIYYCIWSTEFVNTCHFALIKLCELFYVKNFKWGNERLEKQWSTQDLKDIGYRHKCGRTGTRGCKHFGGLQGKHPLLGGWSTGCPSELLLKPKYLREHGTTLQTAAFSQQEVPHHGTTCKLALPASYRLKPVTQAGLLETLSDYAFLDILEISNEQYIPQPLTLNN